VILDQVPEDRPRLEHHEPVVLEHGKLAGRRVLLEGVPRRLEGDRGELVRDPELLEQPDDSNRAGELRVIELQHSRRLQRGGIGWWYALLTRGSRYVPASVAVGKLAWCGDAGG